jgi:predicted RNA-binding protein with PIN domain
MTKKQITDFIKKNIEKFDNEYMIDFYPIMADKNRQLIIMCDSGNKKESINYLLKNIDYYIEQINKKSRIRTIEWNQDITL